MMMNHETFKGVIETVLLNFLPESMRVGKVEKPEHTFDIPSCKA